MRLQTYLSNNNNFLEEYINLCESIGINEMSGDTFKKIEQIGRKMGFRVKKSNSLIDYFKKVGGGMEDILRYATLYMMTDITDSASRKEIIKDAKKALKGVDKKDIVAMLMQLDKSTVGLTSHVRHILQSAFGVEISPINYWYSDVDYIKTQLKKIREVLNKIGNMDKELKALDSFENSLQELYSMVEER